MEGNSGTLGLVIIVSNYNFLLHSEGKKLCKSLKIKPEPYILKHYKDGEYHKDYDRKEMVTSFIAFMKDPTGDAPWEEEDSSQDVFHLANPSVCRIFLPL